MPSGKYTVREREMLMGVAGVPSEFFQSKGFAVSASVFGESPFCLSSEHAEAICLEYVP